MITFTEKGAEKVQEFLASQSADVQTSGLRVGVRGGGCSGFQYALAFDSAARRRQVFEDHGLRILVDGPSLPYVQGRGRRLRRVHAGRRLQGRQPERDRGLRLRLLLPRGGGGRGLRGLSRIAQRAMLRRVRRAYDAADCSRTRAMLRGRRLLGAVGVCALLAGCGPCDGDDEREAAAPPPAAPTASPAAPPRATPTPTAQTDAAAGPGRRARRRADRAEPELHLARGRARGPGRVRALARRARASSSPPTTGSCSTGRRWSRRTASRCSTRFNGGCLRDKQPCAAYGGLRDQLQALAARQREGGWETLVVMSGTPEWAARPAGGCERDNTTPRSRPRARHGDLHAVRRARARRGARAGRGAASTGARGTSPTTRTSSRRSGWSATATRPSAAVAPYVEMARALKAGLDAAPGDQQLVLGELAGLDRSRPMTTSVSEFVADIPEDMACGSAIWTQHGYVGGRDPVDDLERALARKGCKTPEDLDHRDRRRRAAQRRGAADVAGVAGARVRAPAPAAAQVVPGPARVRGVPVHVPRGRPVPDGAGQDRPERRLPGARRMDGVGRRPPADRPAAAQRLLVAHASDARRVAAPMRLYDYAASGNCFKVRLLLGLLGRPYERVPIDIFAGDTLTDAYAEINPLRETPVLELDSGERLAQSSAILWYLAEGTPFLPDDALGPRLGRPVAVVRAGARDGRAGQPALPAAHRTARRRHRVAARHRPRRAGGPRRASRRPRLGRRRARDDRRSRPVPVRQRRRRRRRRDPRHTSSALARPGPRAARLRRRLRARIRRTRGRGRDSSIY